MTVTYPAPAPLPDVIGYVDGRPLPRGPLERRLALLRTGPRSAALPAPGSSEDRQLTRWVAQVILTEELCAAEAAERGLRTDTAPPVRLGQRAAVELGSLCAAAFEGSAAVRAVHAAVTADVQVDPAALTHAREVSARPAPAEAWTVRTPEGTFTSAAEDLPRALVAALEAAEPGTEVTVGPWRARLTARGPAPEPPPVDEAEMLASARRIAFVRWLDAARARRLTLVPGLEHPGDPSQPDNRHRH